MIAYLDSSVLLRIVLREPEPLREWDEIIVGVTSELTRVEAARVIDRLTNLQILQDEEIAEKEHEVADILSRVDFMPIEDEVLSRARQPLPHILGALDAIHLATATIYRDAQPEDEPPIVIATHDRALALCARSLKFRVIGVELPSRDTLSGTPWPVR